MKISLRLTEYPKYIILLQKIFEMVADHRPITKNSYGQRILYIHHLWRRFITKLNQLKPKSSQ